jgi:hypothetical protein
MFAKQIVERGCIYDYSAANDLWRQISEETDPRWESIVEKYEVIRHEMSLSFAVMRNLSRFYSRYDTKVNILNKLRVGLRFSVDPDKDLQFDPKQFVDSPSSNLECINFVLRHGLTALQNQHAVSVMRHSKRHNLVFLISHVR